MDSISMEETAPKVKTQEDHEIRAMKAVTRILTGLSNKERRRVLEWATDRLVVETREVN